MKIVKTVTLEVAERKALEKAFEILDEMSNKLGDKSTYDICNYFCKHMDYKDGKYICPAIIEIDEIKGQQPF